MAESKTQMFIGNLPWSVRARHLEDDFAQFGEVTDAFVAYKGRRSRGFGFVTMARPEDALKAQAALDGKKVGEGQHEREMRVTFAKERSEEDQAKADLAKEAASQKRVDRAKKKESGEGKKKEAGEAGAKPEGEKKKNNRKPRGKKKEKSETVAEVEEGEEGTDIAFNAERKDQSSAEVQAATKGGFGAPKGKAAPKKELTEEEKKARGLLYDTSKASAVREDSDDEEDGDADFAGGDPFEGL